MEGPAGAAGSIAIARRNSAQYYDLGVPATLPPRFLELCVQFEICFAASEQGRAGIRSGARLRLNGTSQTIETQ
jgi:hypothetical protein